MALNSVSYVGRLTRDPEVRYMESGLCISKFDIAVRRMGKDVPPNYFSIVCFSKTAEVVANYTRKGSLVGVSGSLKFEGWADRNSGVPRDKPVIKADKIDLLGSKSDNQQHEDEF